MIIPLIFIEIIRLCFNKEDSDIKKEENENEEIEEEDKNIIFNEMKNFQIN